MILTIAAGKSFSLLQLAISTKSIILNTYIINKRFLAHVRTWRVTSEYSAALLDCLKDTLHHAMLYYQEVSRTDEYHNDLICAAAGAGQLDHRRIQLPLSHPEHRDNEWL